MLITAVARAIAGAPVPYHLATLKAASPVGTTTTAPWAGVLANPTVAGEFGQSLANVGLFDSLLADGSLRRAPLRTALAVVSAAPAGADVAEGALAPVSVMSLSGPSLEPRNVVAVVALTDELLRSTSASGAALLDSELTQAVAVATDRTFLAIITAGATTVSSAGGTAEEIRADIGRLLNAIPSGQRASFVLAVTPSDAKSLSTKSDITGAAAFPEMTPAGGTIAGVRARPFDAVTPGMAVLLDAAQIAADADPTQIERLTQATLNLRSDPDDGASAVMTSLWQTNSVAIGARRNIGVEKLRSTAVAVLTGVTWGGAAS